MASTCHRPSVSRERQSSCARLSPQHHCATIAGRACCVRACSLHCIFQWHTSLTTASECGWLTASLLHRPRQQSSWSPDHSKRTPTPRGTFPCCAAHPARLSIRPSGLSFVHPNRAAALHRAALCCRAHPCRGDPREAGGRGVGRLRLAAGERARRVAWRPRRDCRLHRGGHHRAGRAQQRQDRGAPDDQDGRAAPGGAGLPAAAGVGVGPVDKQAGRQTDGRTDGRTDGQTAVRRLVELVCQQLQVWAWGRLTSRQADRRTDGRMDGQTDERHLVEPACQQLQVLRNACGGHHLQVAPARVRASSAMQPAPTCDAHCPVAS
jgi:hypothetical protein